MKKWSILITVIFLYPLLILSIEQGAGSRILKEVEDAYWQYQLAENAELRMKFGLPVEKMPPVSYAEAKQEAEFLQSLLEKLKPVDAKELTPQQNLSLAILTWELRGGVEAMNYFWHFTPVTPYATTLTTAHRILEKQELKNEKDLQHYQKLLKLYTRYITQTQERLQGQMQKKIVLPKEELDLVIPFIRSFQKQPKDSLFYVKAERISSLQEKQRGDFQKAVEQTIASDILPALSKLSSFLEGEYRNQAPENVGIGQYPGGKEAYLFLVRYHTTLDLTPEQIHEMGMEEVRRIDAEMEKIRNEVGFKGSRKEFHAQLESTARFYAKTPKEVGEVLMTYIRRIEPKVDQYFGTKPKAPYGVRRLDPSLEGAMTFGYYQVPTASDPTGTYYFNGSKLSERSLIGAGSLIYHELVPGHHFQLAIQAENTTLPEFRREPKVTAYVEGWGEYASGLAMEMGMYHDPYEKYGRLALELFLTTRLVVDTGMNHLGWSRQKAAEFMAERLLISPTEIQTETLRYSCDIPGQALAYKIGSKKIYELREKYRKAQGKNFDIRKFHDRVLIDGAMPLSVLEEHVLR